MDTGSAHAQCVLSEHLKYFWLVLQYKGKLGFGPWLDGERHMKTFDMRGPWCCRLVSQHLKAGEDGNYLGSSG